jgi:ribosomal protein L9
MENVPSQITFTELTSLNKTEYTNFFDGYDVVTKERKNPYPDTWSPSVIPQDTRLINKDIDNILKNKILDLNLKILNFSASVNGKNASEIEEIKKQFMTDNAELIRTIVMIIDDIKNVITTPLNQDGSAYLAVTEKKIQKIGKYFSCYVNRTYSIIDSATAGRYDFKIKIDPKITLIVDNVDTIFTLLGFIVHIPGHYFYVKCDNNGNVCAELNDSQTLKPKSIDKYYSGITGFIYKQEDSRVLASPGGGGFKPKYNATTNRVAPKTKHNSSFKASSSKTKGKSHNRSHTQRVK